jgi:V/A-type H+-transporting ATPase subunit I
VAIAKMRKLNLVALSYDRDKILNVLQQTGAVEVKAHTHVDNLSAVQYDTDALSSTLASYESALETLNSFVQAYDKEDGKPSPDTADGFEITYSEFLAAKDLKDQAEKTVTKVKAYVDDKIKIQNSIARLERTVKTATIYSGIKMPLSNFADSAHTNAKLGVIPLSEKQHFTELLKAIDLSDYKEMAASGEELLVLVIAHKSVKAEVEEVLSSCSFVPCPFEGNLSGEQVYNDAVEEIKELNGKLNDMEGELITLRGQIKPLKIYCDYLSFEVEKLSLGDKMLATEKTVLLEGYVPDYEEKNVTAALNNSGCVVYYEFTTPTEDETPPTLMRNKPVLASFEAITNMYSPPNYKEFDPTLIMAFFYSIFLGFIMADIGYGLIMLIGGGVLYFKIKRDSSIKRLAGVFAVGGILAIIWGFLFNSLFGIELSFMPTLMPNAQKDMWSLAGIKVPSVLVISLLIGNVQLFAGYVCRAVQCFRRGEIVDGLCDGVTWAVFSVGVALAIIGFLEEAGLSILATVGGITAAVGLVAAMLTAGRKEKIVGKFTKGFGAAYGVINYASDILSYARLYGLMLSGAVIAQIVSQYGVQFITGGNFALGVLGILLMIVGHAFNLAMSLLGAYIHDARLQYVEFYGRFYEGEGELFAPLGSSHKYIYLKS